MIEQAKVECPECEATENVDRRNFLTLVGGTAVTLASLQAVPKFASAQQPAAQPAPSARAPRPAEALIRELYQGLSAEQRRRVVYPWNQTVTQNNQQVTARLGMYNAAIYPTHTVGAVYTAAQKELNERILRAISSDDEGYSRITRNGTWDASQSFDRCGTYIFGDPTNNQQFAWVFSGHHLTVRCDGNSEPNTAFGGPMYYGHTPDGFSQRNCFNYQTRTVLSVWDALNAQQRQQATIQMYPEPRELAGSIRFRREGYAGISARDLTADQRRLVETVMRDLLSMFRREDGDEVMDLVRRNGGMERLHLGFFREANTPANQWVFWRLEGPGFVWNYRILPHVHCFVNVALAPQQPAARG